jgi:CheY-like chemotaxis protein
MGSAIALEGFAKVIDIAIDCGYTILVHRTPPISPVMCFWLCHYIGLGMGFLYFVELTLNKDSIKFKVETGNEKKKIIVIDDEEPILVMTKGMLDNDYDVSTVKSGKEALDLFFDGFVPNMVLLDLSMPEMGGWDTFIRIRDIGKLHKTPIAIFTSSDDPKDRAKAREMGAVDYINKPIKKAELLEKVAKLVS